MLLTQATLQLAHRCTPAPDGILAVPAVLPTPSRLQWKPVQCHVSHSHHNPMTRDATNDLQDDCNSHSHLEALNRATLFGIAMEEKPFFFDKMDISN